MKKQEWLTIPKSITIYKNNFPNEVKEKIYVDSCMISELKYLWSLGIHTTGCCCGHGNKIGYIGVIEKDIDKMKKLNYTVYKDPIKGIMEDTFVVKTICKER